MKVEKAIEKPEHQISNMAIMPIYIFNQSIFDALEDITPGKGGEVHSPTQSNF